MLQRLRAVLRGGLLMLACCGSASAVPAAATSIVWNQPVDVTGQSSDVITQGTLLGAFGFGPAVTVNGVLFPKADLGPNDANFGVLSGYGAFDGVWDPSYQSLLNSGAYARSPNYYGLHIGKLAKGTYLVQIFMPQWDADWATIFSIAGVDSDVVHASGYLVAPTLPLPRERAQWVSAMIYADGMTDLSLRTKPYTDFQLWGAYQIRVLGVPEPGSWLLLILGFGLVGGVLRAAARRPAGFAERLV